MQKLILSILIVIINFSLFHGVTNFDFVWHDEDEIINYEAVSHPSRDGLINIWKKPVFKKYIPLSVTTQVVTSRIGKQSLKADAPYPVNSKTFHATSLFLHIANSILVMLILSIIIPNLFAAFLGALLFSFHPLQASAFAFSSNLQYVLGSFFALFAIWQYLIYSIRQEPQARHQHKGLKGFYYSATISYILGLLALPAVAMVPFVVAILERIIPQERSLIAPKKNVLPLLLWALIGLPFIIFSFYLQDTTNLSNEIALWSRPFIAGDALSFYLYKIFIPINIVADYGHSPSYVMNHWWGYATWIIPSVLLIVLAFWKEKIRAYLAAAFGIFSFALFPFLGFFTFETQATSTVANPYLYLAMLAPALALAYLASIPKQMLTKIGSTIIVIALGYLGVQQTKHWQNDQILWERTLALNPQSPIAHKFLADEYRKKQNWPEAEKHYKIVLKSNSTDPQVYYYLAYINFEKGKIDAAMDFAKRSLTLNNKNAKAHNILGIAYLEKSKPELALSHFKKASALDQKSEYFLSLGETYSTLKKYKEAIPALQKSIRPHAIQLPETKVAYAHSLLGKALLKTGQLAEGQRNIEQSLKFNAETPEANKILADIYYEQGKLKEALPHYLKAIPKYPNDTQVLTKLAHALMSQGRNADAVRYYEKVLTIEPKNAQILTKIGKAHYNLKHLKTSEKFLRQAIELEKKRPEAYYLLGEISRWKGKTSDALSYYYMTLKYDKKDSLAHTRLGNYFMRENKYKKARYHFKAALKNAPKNIRYISNLRRANKKIENSSLF